MRVRVAEPDDFCEVAHLHATSWRESYRGLVPDDFLDNIDPLTWARRYAARSGDGSTMLLAAMDQQIVGMVRFGADRQNPELAEIYALYVAPGQQRTGIGTALLGSALTCLPAVSVRLWCAEGNLTARAYYERHGFVADGGVADYCIAGSAVPVLRYVLDRNRLT
jgi:ribosomal protein S18 acetylase RimI-like enzyme